MLTANRKSLIYGLVLALCLGLNLLRPADAALWDVLNPQEIPVFPAFEKTSEKKMVINGVAIRIEMFKGANINIPQVVDYYKKILAQKGWIIHGDDVIMQSGVVLNFTDQEKRFLSLSLLSGGKLGKSNYVYMMMRYSLEGINKWIQRSSQTDNDMPGQDIPWLKRYPGSIRTNSTSSDNGSITINYILINNSCVDCLTAFYKEQMVTKGWELVSDTRKNKDEIMKEISSFDEGGASAKTPEATGDNSGAGSDNSDTKGLLKKYSQKYAPDESSVLFFQKGSDVCNIFIAYKNLQGDKQEQEGQEIPDEVSKNLEELEATNRIVYLQNMQEKSKEIININITYFPKPQSKVRQKSWF